jgi:hypothetical protein
VKKQKKLSILLKISKQLQKKTRRRQTTISVRICLTEDKDLPKTEGDYIKQTETVAVDALEVLAIPVSTSHVVGTSESSSSSSSSTSTSSSSSSTVGSGKSGDISSLDSSDSYSDSDSSAVNNKKYKYYKMPSSIIKSSVSDGSRATFEEWHSLWEVFGQEQGFDEYQSIVPHLDLPVDGHNAVKPVKTEKKALRKNKKAIASLRVIQWSTFCGHDV